MNSINVMGRLTADPELRNTQTGKKVLTFRVAVNTGFGDRQQTDFFKVSLWNDYAVTMSKYLSKGRLIGVSGEVHLEEFEGKNGKGATMVITNANVTLADSGNSSSKTNNQQGGQQNEMFDDMSSFEEV